MSELSTAMIARYQFSVPIGSQIDILWPIMIDRINDWWPDDFRALGAGSTVSLTPTAGGSLLETDVNGGSLEWFRVQMISPPDSLYLVGNLAPDWGGPTVSMLKLALVAKNDGCVLSVSDALMGNVTEASAASASDGWKQVFGNLKCFAEAS